MPQFEQVNTFISQIFWLVIFYGLIVAVLKWRILPRLHTILDRRRLRIDNLIQEAGMANTETARIKEEIHAATIEARKEANTLLDITRDEIKKKEQALLQKLSSQLEKQLHEAEAQLERTRQDLQSSADKLVRANVELIFQGLSDQKITDSIYQSATQARIGEKER